MQNPLDTHVKPANDPPMTNRLKYLWQNHKLLLSGFTIAAVLTAFFAVRMVVSSIYWGNPDHQNQPLEGWMTPRYVAMSYGLERQEVEQVLGMDPTSVARVHLNDLLKAQGMTLKELQARIDAIVAARPRE